MFGIPIVLAVLLVRRLEKRRPAIDEDQDQDESVSQ